MLHAHSRMCTCMQTNLKKKKGKSEEVWYSEATGEFNKHVDH